MLALAHGDKLAHRNFAKSRKARCEMNQTLSINVPLSMASTSFTMHLTPNLDTKLAGIWRVECHHDHAISGPSCPGASTIYTIMRLPHLYHHSPMMSNVASSHVNFLGLLGRNGFGGGMCSCSPSQATPMELCDSASESVRYTL